MTDYLFFDSASTTKCDEATLEVINKYNGEHFGNPSSSHAYGQTAALAMREARFFFADHFKIQPDQVIFTGSGTEANNLALWGIASKGVFSTQKENPLRILTSAVEHPSVKKTIESFEAFGIKSDVIGVNAFGHFDLNEALSLLTPQTALMSVQTVNQITGAIFPVEKIAQRIKEKSPRIIFHTDAIQAFGKVQISSFPSSVDLISISGHKIGGPKGIGALIILNRKILLSHQLRPLLWGGEQEQGLRSGTQNVGLIAGFHFSAQNFLNQKEEIAKHFTHLRNQFRELLLESKLIDPIKTKNTVQWNSPLDGIPSIISLSVPGIPSSTLARLLEERGCLVSVGSACGSKKPETQSSGIRISFTKDLQTKDIVTLVHALQDSIDRARQLMGSLR